MNQFSANYQRVMAIAPCTAGFGFIVLEGSERLIDYGVKVVQGDKNSASLKKVADLIKYYQPKVIALETPTDKACRRRQRVQELLREIAQLASSKRIKIQSFSRSQIRKSFSPSNSFTKYQIALTLAEQFSELTVRLPAVRKPWMGEDKRMSIFDAAALALTHFLEEP